MPFVKPKKPKQQVFRATLARAVGTGADFHVLAYCPDLDELAKADDPDSEPTTFIFRYRLPDRTVAAKYPRRLDDLWQRSDGTIMAVGDTRGVMEITSAGLTEEAALGKRVFSAIWGSDDAHLFVAGCHPSFICYRLHGKWRELSVPTGSGPISAIGGLSESDVYFAGEHGQVLHFDGREVTRLDVPARFHLTSVKRLSATQVSMCGYGGTLLVGNRNRWRHVVTETHAALLAHAVLDGRICYVAEKRLWSTDGSAPAAPVLPIEARWIAGLADGLILGSDTSAKLYSGGKLTELDVTI
jgi:hypothetical protein